MCFIIPFPKLSINQSCRNLSINQQFSCFMIYGYLLFSYITLYILEPLQGPLLTIIITHYSVVRSSLKIILLSGITPLANQTFPRSQTKCKQIPHVVNILESIKTFFLFTHNFSEKSFVT